MIPVVQERDVVSGGSKASAAFDISQENVAHILTILRDTLYSDKIMAVLREYGANAWDEHRKCGKADVPIKVQLPTIADPTLRIRDYGPGLSVDDVERIFTKYGASTKRGDNEAVGMLGIGSKSGFAYADSFGVTTWHGGFRREYVAVIDASQKGRMDLLYEKRLEGQEASETGLEISLAVRPQDIREFDSRAKTLFVHYVPRPTINVTLPGLPDGKEIGGLGRIFEDNNWERRGKWIAVMGCVPYRIALEQLGKVAVDGRTESVSPCASNIGGLVRFDIGELQVAASREELKYGDATRLAIIRKVNELIDEYVRTMLDGVDKLPQWERRLRVIDIHNKQLPVPKDKQEWQEGWVYLKPSVVPGPNGLNANGQQRHVVRISERNYNGNQTPTTQLRVLRQSRLVVKDDNKRTIKGFDLRQEDLLIAPETGYSMQSCEAEIKRLIATHRIEGIPVVKLSSLTWVAPTRSVAVRDSAKAKAQMLVLDTKTQDFGMTPLSRHWTVVDRNPDARDVWVVLDAYRTGNCGPMGDFYEQWQADERVLKGIGLQMPAIIGYKEMAAKPLVRAKLPGTEYSAWRKAGLLELMKTHAGMKPIIEALENGGGELSYDMDVGLLTSALGATHPITRLAQQMNDARTFLAKADRKLLDAAKQVRGGETKVDRTAGLRKEIADKYPLLAVVSLEAAFGSYSSHRKLWTDYVAMVDDVGKMTKPAEQKKENAA